MLVLLSIDESKSSEIMDKLLGIEGVEIFSENPNIAIPYMTPTIDDNSVGIIEACKNLNMPYLVSDLRDLLGCRSSWFMHILSKAYRKARFRYLDAILLWASKLYIFCFTKPFIKRLYHRKAFMKLKCFMNIRRCYSF